MGCSSLEWEEKGFHLIHINVQRFTGKAYLLMFASPSFCNHIKQLCKPLHDVCITVAYKKVSSVQGLELSEG